MIQTGKLQARTAQLHLSPFPTVNHKKFSRKFTTCDVAKWRVVGKAEPHPSICSSNFSIAAQMYTSFFDICAIMGQTKKAPDHRSAFPLYRNKNYFFPSNCSFKAAKASMSPSVVEAAWFWIIGASSLLLEDFLAPEAAFFSALSSALATSSKIRL